ncbi:TrmH family RNA methyltransferase [Thermoactinomyces mirandus]|uniref:RNA methyltransferase n=1 Tax=Thermoactinomyces mirandus TaxID=2756294 RepID=A0A7W2AQ68_9BACL|nr:RNA methyltransferase [Thermoactinomyces mirandus]MBA4601669.1 RNA methyltransferase [Thermoactinomyces mirandus]
MKQIHSITSSDNRQFKQWKKLKTRKERKKQGAFLIEGEHLLEEAADAQLTFQAAIFSRTAEEKITLWLDKFPEQVPVYVLLPSLFHELTETKTPQGMAAVVKWPYWPLERIWQENRPEKTFLLLDCVQDPGNLGTLIRTAKAAGIDGIFLGKGSVDPFNGKVVRSAMGAIFKLPLWQMDLEEVLPGLKKRGVTIVNTSPRASLNHFDYTFPDRVAILLGNEGRGVQQAFAKYVDVDLKIPMPGETESLNVSVTGSILLYERIRQQYYLPDGCR